MSLKSSVWKTEKETQQTEDNWNISFGSEKMPRLFFHPYFKLEQLSHEDLCLIKF